MTVIKQPKKVKLTPREAAEQHMAKYADVYDRRAAMQLAMKERIALIQDEYAGDLEDCDKELEKLETELNVFAENNPEEFNGKKSLKLQYGSIGWRADIGKLVIEEGISTMQVVKVLQKDHPDAIKIDTRRVVSLCKNMEILAVKLQKIGVTVEQSDKFYVQPNK